MKASAARGRPARAWGVLISDPDPSRRARVEAVVRACRADPLVSPDRAAVIDPACGNHVLVGLVFLEGDAAGPDSALDVVRRLKRSGVETVCYGDRTSGWPASWCCKLLVAGARCVLDSAGADFHGQLHGRLGAVLKAASARREAIGHWRDLMTRLGIAGESHAIMSTMKWIERVSRFSSVPVLITGETGTGKELAAKAIHLLDPLRRDGPFVAVNCGAIHPYLVEDELFGHRKGAFTGAVQERAGLIRSAAGGVLFLDEIAEMDTALQTRLLRVVQNKTVTGLGEDRERKIDVRIIAATNQDLRRRVAERKFREDLFYRINVLSIHLPPLRSRPEDIGPLCEHLISKFDDLRCGRRVSAGKDYLEALKRLRLPGNVRELENILRYALANKEDEGALDLPDLPPYVLRGLSTPEAGIGPPRRGPPQAPPAGTITGRPTLPLTLWARQSSWQLPAFVDRCERYLIEAALLENKGNRSKAARLLGVSSRTVYNKMRKHGLIPPNPK